MKLPMLSLGSHRRERSCYTASLVKRLTAGRRARKSPGSPAGGAPFRRPSSRWRRNGPPRWRVAVIHFRRHRNPAMLKRTRDVEGLPEGRVSPSNPSDLEARAGRGAPALGVPPVRRAG